MIAPDDDPLAATSATMPDSAVTIGLPRALHWLRRTWVPFHWSPGMGWVAWS